MDWYQLCPRPVCVVWVVHSQAGAVLGAIKDGQIDKFFVIGGCDGSEGERSYFTDLATHLDSKSVVLTMGCGKVRVPPPPLQRIYLQHSIWCLCASSVSLLHRPFSYHGVPLTVPL